MENQLKQEKIENISWKLQTKELQQKLIELGIDPKNTKAMKYLNKENDNEIQVLKKKLKIPNT